MSAHTPTPWSLNSYGTISSGDRLIFQSWEDIDIDPDDAAFIVRACNAHDDLVAAAKAAIRYEDAIRSCANDPKRMASFCTAEGDDLDALYFDWLTKSKVALDKAGTP